jgi:hypothetical protein
MWGSSSGSGPLGGLQGLFQPPSPQKRNSGPGSQPDGAAAQPSGSSSPPEAFDDGRTSTRRVKVRKVRGAARPHNEEFDRQAERRIAEIVPGLADLDISANSMEGPLRTARDIRVEKHRQQQETIDEIKELEDIYNMAKPNPVDDEPRPEGWDPKARPTPRTIRLSPYEYEMINYQRMHLRKNIWCAAAPARALRPGRAGQAGRAGRRRHAQQQQQGAGTLGAPMQRLRRRPPRPPPSDPPAPKPNPTQPSPPLSLPRRCRYYRDRMSVPRGPCPLHMLKDAWVQGVIDENTMVWGHGLFDWLPAKNIKLLIPMIRTPEGGPPGRASAGLLAAGRSVAAGAMQAAGRRRLLLLPACRPGPPWLGRWGLFLHAAGHCHAVHAAGRCRARAKPQPQPQPQPQPAALAPPPL